MSGLFEPLLGAHWGFIVAAWGLTALGVGGLIAAVIADYRAQARILADLEARGVRRRSGTAPR